MWQNTNFGSGGSGGSGEIDPTVLAQIEKNKQDILLLKATAGGTYTNMGQSSVTVGGINAGSTFNEQTMTQMFDKMLYKELTPSLTNPSFTFVENAPELVEVGSTTSIRFTTTFNRGSINPKYTTSGFRSGLPTQYVYTGTGLPATFDSTSLTDIQNVSFRPTAVGTTTWTASVKHSAGEQPKTNTGNNFSSPLPAGTLTAKSVKVEAVYAYYANTADIETMTKQALTNGSYLQADVAGETETVKQSIEYASVLGAVSGIQFFSTVSNSWEWLGGSKEKSLEQFDSEVIDKAGVSYNKYTNTTSKVGARQLRFHL